MDYCSECESLLKIKEIEGKLMKKCFQCLTISDNTDDIIHVVNYKKQSINSDKTNPNIIYDITQPRTKKIQCINKDCISHKNNNIHEIVMYTNELNQQLKYVCVNCKTEWGY